MKLPSVVFGSIEDGESSIPPVLVDAVSTVSFRPGGGATVVSATAGPRSSGFSSSVTAGGGVPTLDAWAVELTVTVRAGDLAGRDSIVSTACGSCGSLMGHLHPGSRVPALRATSGSKSQASQNQTRSVPSGDDLHNNRISAPVCCVSRVPTIVLFNRSIPQSDSYSAFGEGDLEKAEAFLCLMNGVSPCPETCSPGLSAISACSAMISLLPRAGLTEIGDSV